MNLPITIILSFELHLKTLPLLVDAASITVDGQLHQYQRVEGEWKKV